MLCYVPAKAGLYRNRNIGTCIHHSPGYLQHIRNILKNTGSCALTRHPCLHPDSRNLCPTRQAYGRAKLSLPAALDMLSASAPNICMPTGRSESSISSFTRLFSAFRIRPSADMNSEYDMSAPCSRHRGAERRVRNIFHRSQYNGIFPQVQLRLFSYQSKSVCIAFSKQKYDFWPHI